MRVGVILASVREGRNGEIIADWIMKQFALRPDIQVELIDLREWAFSSYESAFGPQQAEKNFSPDSIEQLWFDQVDRLDAFVIVTPEYNHGYPGSLKNALDTVYSPWNYKPVAFVSYGFGAAGSRAVEQLRLVAIELRMIPICDELNISLSPSFDGAPGKRAMLMIDELLWWSEIMMSKRPTRLEGSLVG